MITLDDAILQIYDYLEAYNKDVVYDLLQIIKNPEIPFVLFFGKMGTMIAMMNKNYDEKIIKSLITLDRDKALYYDGYKFEWLTREEGIKCLFCQV